MTRLSADELARRTLVRQFPVVSGVDDAAVLELLDRLGPVQSQVPRSPFLTAASRLPGVERSTVRRLFEEHRLLKTSSLRGTVHTGVVAQYPGLDAVARRGRRGMVAAQLRLSRVTPEELLAELEAFAADAWRPRTEVVEHAGAWLAVHESAAVAASVTASPVAALLWGHSGLLRRPPDQRWETRTDVLHRRARSVVPGLPEPTFAVALAGLVRVHLGAVGPATRADLAFFCGTTLGAVDTAVADLGEALVRLDGPDGETFVDLAEPGPEGPGPVGVRLLPEFDALLVGFHGRHRTRFLDAEQLVEVWAKANGQFAPVVLREGRLVATWRTVAVRSSVRVEVRPLSRCRAPDEAELAEPAAAAARALGADLADVRVV
ncbi:Winged helix DNA-binding domain-containing protein [Friedmanniella luteola]|uniref:Winged helix DNA-binding domain-containing protein n=1 Tax=Friedmanniella luteola TaxID=546871 RepID=A0A1H1XA05_9ACTN|nr:crosslink repair DNA glycosylase YcaQ family protein [Friedmanniella luteola]SDT06062.1 Winged helix DNA-binding domain-containing protein [Friedmanniella luteola]